MMNSYRAGKCPTCGREDKENYELENRKYKNSNMFARVENIKQVMKRDFYQAQKPNFYKGFKPTSINYSSPLRVLGASYGGYAPKYGSPKGYN